LAYKVPKPTLIMLFNYIKIAIRTLKRSLSYTIINIFGLALGLTCAILIFLLVNYHLSFDQFHNNDNRIYRFVTEQHRDQVSYVPNVPPAFGKAFREDYTYGEKVARVCTLTEQLVTIEQNGKVNKYQETASFADPEFFDIFNFPLVSGNPEKFLSAPNTAIITERMARKYFGDESPLGKNFRFDNRMEFQIVGVLKDIPDNTDFRSEIYLSYSTIKDYNEWYAADDAWGGITTEIQTFTRLMSGVKSAEVESVLPAYVKKYRAESKNVHHYKLQPLADIHFNSKYDGRMSITTIWGLSIIGFFLIFTACLNFINLATAQAIKRSKEVGVRKVLGSQRWQLFWQFTLETAVIVVAATVIALSASYAAMPFINTLFDSRIALNIISDPALVAFVFLMIVIVTLLSGFYPGMILSGFKPVVALKGKLTANRSGGFNLRRSLIVTQFTISQILLIGLIVVVYQMRYFKQTDMGFSQDGIVMIPAGPDQKKMSTLKTQLQQIPHVENVSLCFSAPASNNRWGTSMTFDNKTEGEDFGVSFRGGDEDYLATFGIEIVAGRNLTPSDTAREFLVNEELVHKLNLSSTDEILGKPIRVNGSWTGPVVGVVSNFHDLSLRSPISPVFITTSKENYYEIGVKINMKDAATTLAAIEKVWSATYPEQIYEYHFLDDQTAQFYKTEETMLKLVQTFSFIALFIGCLGLYGLVSFMAVQKTKEIGIRKVLGGDVLQMVWIFGKEFTLLVFGAFLVAAPVGWWIMSYWLENYVYRIDITAWIFVLELSVIFFIVIVTVGYQSLKAALMNPVNSLRTE
jgi:putative ABC transport system permease protein